MGINGIHGPKGISSVNISMGSAETPNENEYVGDTVTSETLNLNPNAVIGYSLVQMGNKQKSRAELLRGINEVLKSRGEPEIPLMALSKGYLKKEGYSDEYIANIMAKFSLATDMLDAGFNKDDIATMISVTTADNEKIVRTVIEDRDIDISRFVYLVDNTTEKNIDLIKDFVKDSSVDINRICRACINNNNIDIVRSLLNRDDIPDMLFGKLTTYTNKNNLDFAKQLLATDSVCTPNLASSILLTTVNKDPDTLELQRKFYNELISDPNFDISRFDHDNNDILVYSAFSDINNDNYEAIKSNIYRRYKFLPIIEPKPNSTNNHKPEEKIENKAPAKTSNYEASSEYYSEKIDIGDFDSVDAPVYIEHEIKDKAGNVVNHQIFTESDIVGEYEIWQTNADGTQSLIGLAEKDEQGGTHVEKHLTSLDGTVTDIVFADDVAGNNFLHEKITDNTGKVLMEYTKQRKQISDNHYQTALNGQWTDVQVIDNKFVITKLDENKEPTPEQVVYTIKNFSDEEKINIEQQMYKLKNIDSIDEMKATTQEFLKKNNLENIIDKRVVQLMKNLSGEEWLNLAHSGTKFVYNSNIEGKYNGFAAAGFIGCSTGTLNELNMLEHELGHEKFAHLNLHKDEKLKQIYEEEKAMFIETFPNRDIETIDYFLNDEGSRNFRAINETVAEINMLLNTRIDNKVLQARSSILQQYFPRTIAYLSEKLLDV